MPLQVQSLRPDGLLLVSTLDGSLHALSKQTGDLKWTLKDGERGAVTPPSLEPELEWCPWVQSIRRWDVESHKPVSAGSFST